MTPILFLKNCPIQLFYDWQRCMWSIGSWAIENYSTVLFYLSQVSSRNTKMTCSHASTRSISFCYLFVERRKHFETFEHILQYLFDEMTFCRREHFLIRILFHLILVITTYSFYHSHPDHKTKIAINLVGAHHVFFVTMFLSWMFKFFIGFSTTCYVEYNSYKTIKK